MSKEQGITTNQLLITDFCLTLDEILDVECWDIEAVQRASDLLESFCEDLCINRFR